MLIAIVTEPNRLLILIIWRYDQFFFLVNPESGITEQYPVGLVAGIFMKKKNSLPRYS